MLDRVKLLSQVADALFGQAAVDFQLLLARAAQPHTALRLPREVRPHPLQSRHLVFELGQLDRQPGLVRPGTVGEDVEDQLRAVQHLQPGGLFQVARLAGAEVVVEDDHVGHFGVGQGGQFLHFTLAQVGRGVGGLAVLGQLADDVRAGRLGEALQFLQRDGLLLSVGEINPHQNG